ncbi:DUF6497 family protein [Sedimentitalea sp. JM2-8]|uniref:DUF6497 family protein n=1 Tax=Sedimentitalea xiamensis TaxID=3050037 RepID=A0ABT7FIH4_9RHOB|nr:DUF6497 family protein [Sedimentitalea xiamensis]MDK3074934.1 DUF6497 family protein [Sedimentitalea xiamensis]
MTQFAPHGQIGVARRIRTVCRLCLAAVPGLAALPSAAQQEVAVPSGQPVVLSEVLVDDSPGETWVRFRFLAPRIARDGGDVDYDVATQDMEHICGSLVLPYLKTYDLSPARVVISLSDRDVPFGSSDPQATQFFEAYRPENANCIWEEF